MKAPIHVAVGVIEDAQGRILIARRLEHLHQGGLWEFPGGKVDKGEDVLSALRRELHEELGIHVEDTKPLITIEHDYGDKQVLLDVHRITDFQGMAHGKEGQKIRWVTRNEIKDYTFPAANRGIVNAILLPEQYMITADFSNDDQYLNSISIALKKGVKLIQLRASQYDEEKYTQLSKKVVSEFGEKVSIVLNTGPEVFADTQATGLHLNSRRLMQLSDRPIDQSKLLSASVHSKSELEQAKNIGVDFVVASPVKPTRSHSGATPLGWDLYAELVLLANCPVYALGGMKVEDLDTARRLGGQGIAGISMFE